MGIRRDLQYYNVNDILLQVLKWNNNLLFWLFSKVYDLFPLKKKRGGKKKVLPIRNVDRRTFDWSYFLIIPVKILLMMGGRRKSIPNSSRKARRKVCQPHKRQNTFSFRGVRHYKIRKFGNYETFLLLHFPWEKKKIPYSR